MIKYNEILKKSQSIVKNVKKEYKLGESSKWSYYIAKAIINNKNNVKRINFKNAPKPNGTYINGQLNKSVYIDLAKQLIKFVEQHKRLPNYLTWKENKIRCRLYTLMFAKILIHYEEKNKLPSEVSINSKSFKKPSKNTASASNSVSKNQPILKDYLTEQGCSGIGQCTSYYCACNSLQQSFYRLTGIKVEEKTIAGWAGTTSSGTSHQGIETAVAQFNKTYKKNIKITWKNFSELGSNESERWKNLQKHIDNGAVFCHIAYRRTNSFKGYGHYEVIKSVNEANLSILNSLGKSCGNGTYCGYIETRTKATQLFYMNGISQKSIAILTN